MIAPTTRPSRDVDIEDIDMAPRSARGEAHRDRRAEGNFRDGIGIPLDEAEAWAEALLRGENPPKPKARRLF